MVQTTQNNMQQHQSLSNNTTQVVTVSNSNAKSYGAKNAAFLTGTKSPNKKVNKKLSHKMQHVGYTAETSTATKKILTQKAAHVGSSSKDSSEHANKVLKGSCTTSAGNTVLASYQPSQNSLKSSSH